MLFEGHPERMAVRPRMLQPCRSRRAPQSRPAQSAFNAIRAGRRRDRSVSALPFQVRSFPARSDVVRERDRSSQCCLLLKGISCRYKITSDGRRQIFSFHLAGDIPDLHSLHLDAMDHSFGAVAPITVGFIPHAILRNFLRTHSRISEVFWRDTLVEASIFRAWMTGLGARSAAARTAHFFCEIVTRLRSVPRTRPSQVPTTSSIARRRSRQRHRRMQPAAPTSLSRQPAAPAPGVEFTAT